MAIESATYINQLDATKPGSGDPKSEGDDHLRLLKSAIKATFPNVTGAVTANHADLNVMAGAATGAVSGLNVTTQATTDNTTKAASTAYVQSAILASSGITAQLPAQSGNSGKYLTTNGTAASWGTVVSLGVGGTTLSSSTTLTSSDDGAIYLTPSGYGMFITLPDATTCNKGVSLYLLCNRTSYPVGIRDSAGTRLGWVPPLDSVQVGLAENTTAAGSWALINADVAAVTGCSLKVTAGMFTPCETVALDANRTFILLTNGEQLYGVVHDASTGAFGVVTAIRTNATLRLSLAALQSTNQVMVCSCSTTTAFEAVIVSVSGTTITVNTAATATLSASVSVNAQGGLISLGGTMVAYYSVGTPAAQLRAMTVSGTTITIGAAQTTTATAAISMYAVSSTVGLAIGGNGPNQYAQPFTVSGTTISFGTAASWAATPVGADMVTRQFGARYLVLNTNSVNSALVSVSGTTATASTFTMAITSSDIANGYFNDVQISSTKWYVCSHNSSSGFHGIITDNNGTASFSAGTGIPNWNYPTYRSILKASASLVYVLYQTALEKDTSTTFLLQTKVAKIDVSGATPVAVDSASFLMHEYSQNGSVDNKINILPSVLPSYCGAFPEGCVSRYLDPYRVTRRGSVGVIGATGSVGATLHGIMNIVCSESGVARREIPSLTLMGNVFNQDDSSPNARRSLRYFGDETRQFAISGDGNNPSMTIFSVECAA